MKRSRSDQAPVPLTSEQSGANILPETQASASCSSSARRRQALDHKNSNDDAPASLDKNSQKETPATLLTPHTHRLLKLILEGTAEHAAEASVHLTTIAASQQCSATQLWEILGRLQEGLRSNAWKTRSQAADALQGIARQLPLSDQLGFLQRDKEEGGATLFPKGDTVTITTQQEIHHYLTIQDLSVGGLEKVLAEGRLLMATSSDRYDVMKERELRDMDRYFIQNRVDGTGRKADFLERRMKFQRHILAQRLGLAGIGDILGEQNVLPQAITSEDLLEAEDDSELPEAKCLRLEQRSNRKSSSQEKMRSSGNILEESFSVRALLVMEMEEHQRKDGGALLSHRSPQELLATELVYRMFDPAWHVRHGALLGTLSLLRAWKTYAKQNDDIFGKWPHDVLARCLGILALDRFGDFSGALSTAITSNATGNVVAPVREVSGQLVSVLFIMAPESEQLATLDLLFRLCEYSKEWEPRHGALCALKYILVVLNTKIMPNEGACEIDVDHCKKMIDQIARVSIRCLRDASDDVKGTAAQLAAEYLRSHTSIPSFLLKSSPDIIRSVKTARNFSSCIVDLVQLLAEMLRIDAQAFVMSVSLPNGFASNMTDVSGIILGLLDSDYESVRRSALRSVGTFCKLLCSESVIEENDTQNDLHLVVAKTCRRFAETLFEWYFSSREDSEPHDDDVAALLAMRNDVWNDLMVVVQFLCLHSVDEMRKLGLNLVTRYFWIEDLLRSNSNDTPIFPRASSALASFFVATKCNLSSVCQNVLLCMLDSPWVYHCEASCLLFGSLCARKTTLPDMNIVRLSLDTLLLETPLCLVVREAPNFAEIIGDKAFFNLCREVFWAEICRSVPHAEAAPPVSASKKTSQIWTAALRSRGLTLSRSSTKPASVCCMRVEACIGSAIVQSRLPAKITPVVRSFMTSLKNESNPLRQELTCRSLVLLVQELTHKPAQGKILDKICKMANNEDSSGSSSEALRAVAGRVVCSVTRSLASADELQAMEPFWSRLSILLSCTKNDSALPSATRFLQVFVQGLTEGTELVTFLIDLLTEPLIKLFSDVDSSTRDAIVSSLSNVCSLHPEHLLLRSLPALLKLLEHQSDQVRLLSCTLLKDLVEVSGTTASRFVRFLLPVVMKLMADGNETCSMTANALFANLVRVAPLAQGNSAITLQLGGTYSKCEHVIDHLIFGQSLPACEIPTQICEELEMGGIQLREYQVEGVSFLRFLHSVGLNGAICDSMGLGKTLQALVAVATSHISPEHLKADSLNCPLVPVSLVVCPASVVGHWMREVDKYFPGDTVFRSLCYVGSASARRALRSQDLLQRNLIITSYSILRSDIEFLAGHEWMCCVLDEGHLLKNPLTATARACKRLRSTHRIILTGTPVQNKVSEIWAMFDFLLPNFLGTWRSFSKEYARPIMRSQQPGASAALVQDGMTKLKVLHQQVLPFILRREKEQVLRELPPKNITVVSVPLSDLQQCVYRDFCAKVETSKTIETLGNGLSDALISGESVNAEVLKSILFLRLLCTHPSLILPKTKDPDTRTASWFSLNSSGKLMALGHLLAEAGIFDDSIAAADNDETLLYCEDDAKSSDAYGDVASFQGDSLLGYSTEITSTKSKCLIFSQFSASLDIIEELLFRQKMPSLRYLRLDGSVPPEMRAEVAEAFNRDPSISVLLLTTRVGGLGLNLTGADIVIFLESDFNPFADLQAMDRAHRMGQNRTVNVYRLITKDSIEEKILELQERKIATSEAIVNTDNSTMYQMGTERLLDIFSFKTTSEINKDASGDYDLDALMENFADDYASLSVGAFTNTLK